MFDEFNKKMKRGQEVIPDVSFTFILQVEAMCYINFLFKYFTSCSIAIQNPTSGQLQ